MDRRQFLQAALLPLVAREGPALDDLGRVTIKKITGFAATGTRPKMIGKNAQRDDHGRSTSEDVLRIETNLGALFEGFGLGRVEPTLAKSLIGHSLDEYWKPGIGVMSPLGRPTTRCMT